MAKETLPPSRFCLTATSGITDKTSEAMMSAPNITNKTSEAVMSAPNITVTATVAVMFT